MKKMLGVLMVVVLLALSGCLNENKAQNKDTYFYFGQSNSWFATYSITKAKSSYYDSLSIQYLFDANEGKGETGKIGPIEYLLNGNSIIIQSAYPQELQGVANFHTGSRMNADVTKITFDKDIELIVKWQGKSETIKLARQN
jgi:hypothetical protein